METVFSVSFPAVNYHKVSNDLKLKGTQHSEFITTKPDNMTNIFQFLRRWFTNWIEISLKIIFQGWIDYIEFAALGWILVIAQCQNTWHIITWNIKNQDQQASLT